MVQKDSTGQPLPEALTETQMEEALKKPLLWLSDSQVEAVKQLHAPGNYTPFPSELGNKSIWCWMGLEVSAQLNLGHCCAIQVARDLAVGGSSSVYEYLFAYAPEHERMFPGPGNVMASHGAEIDFAFDIPELTSESPEFASAVSEYWVRFVVTGDPNRPQ